MGQAQVRVQGLDSLTIAGLSTFLRNSPDIVVTGGGPDTPVDVVVVAMDVFSAEAVALLRRTAAEVGKPIVLICNEVDSAQLFIAVECRVVAILSRTAAADTRLSRAVRCAAESGGKLPPALLGRLLAHVEQLNSELLTGHGLAGSRLSGREVEILRLMADGMHTVQIASTMNYSERTIKNIIYTITRRLHLRNRPHAVAYAMRAGLI